MVVALPLVAGIACSGRGLWPPYVADAVVAALPSVALWGGADAGDRQRQKQKQKQKKKQIPFGNDKQRGMVVAAVTAAAVVSAAVADAVFAAAVVDVAVGIGAVVAVSAAAAAVARAHVGDVGGCE